MKRRKLNIKRKVGRFEFEQVSQRYSDGSPTGGFVLWVRMAKGSSKCGTGRRVAYATFDPTPSHSFIEKLRAGLGCYPASPTPIAVAHSLRRHLLEA